MVREVRGSGEQAVFVALSDKRAWDVILPMTFCVLPTSLSIAPALPSGKSERPSTATPPADVGCTFIGRSSLNAFRSPPSVWWV